MVKQSRPGFSMCKNGTKVCKCRACTCVLSPQEECHCLKKEWNPLLKGMIGLKLNRVNLFLRFRVGGGIKKIERKKVQSTTKRCFGQTPKPIPVEADVTFPADHPGSMSHCGMFNPLSTRGMEYTGETTTGWRKNHDLMS